MRRKGRGSGVGTSRGARAGSPRATADAAFRAVHRACYAGLGTAALCQEVIGRSAPAVDADARGLTAADPDTGIAVHAAGTGFPDATLRDFFGDVYPRQEAVRFMDMAASGTPTAIVETRAAGDAAAGRFVSGDFIDLMRRDGFSAELRAVVHADQEFRGTLCALRGGTTRGFTDRESDFFRRIAPHVAKGLRAAALRDAAGLADADAGPTGARTPGVVAVDHRWRVTLRSGAADGYLVDLGGPGSDPEELPLVVRSLVGVVRTRRSGDRGAGVADLAVEVHACGRTASYVLRGTLSEPDASGDTQVVIVIEAAGRATLAPRLTRLYGLTAREREVVALAARGEGTRRIAHLLGISYHTVLDHLYRACDKVGVRGRRRLVAKLYLDLYDLSPTSPTTSSRS